MTRVFPAAVVFAAITLVLCAPVARAQGGGPLPDEVLFECEREIALIVDICDYRIERSVEKFEDKIDRQADKRKPGRKLDKTVKKGKKNVRGIGRGAVTALAHIERDCLIDLARAGGGPQEDIILFGMIDRAIEELEFQVESGANDLDDKRARVRIQQARPVDVNLDIGDIDHEEFEDRYRRKHDGDKVVIRINNGTLFFGLRLRL